MDEIYANATSVVPTQAPPLLAALSLELPAPHIVASLLNESFDYSLLTCTSASMPPINNMK